MATVIASGLGRPLHPLQAITLASLVPLFLGALLGDIAYARSFQVQWANFSSWLIAGGLVFGAVAVVWAAVDLVRSGVARRKRRALDLVVLVVLWLLGFINALVHAKDAWATMPEGLYLSAIIALLAGIAVWMGHSRLNHGDVA